MAIRYLTNKDDTWTGTKYADIVFGRGGNDWLDGKEGKDQLHGGDGNDTLLGGTEADKLYGDAGNDFLIGGNGNDQIWGGKGNDYLGGGSGNDRIWGGDGDDTIVTGGGVDELHGGNGNDQVLGGLIADGGAGDDNIGTTSSLLDNNVSDLVHTETGGSGHDMFTPSSNDDGIFQTIIVTDFSRDDKYLYWTTFDYAKLASEGYAISSSELGVEDGHVVVADNIEIQQVGSDLVVTGGLDHDQIILKNAADWLHLA